MPRGAVLCTNCGYNIVTRQRTGTGRAAAAGRAKAARPEGVAGWFKTPYPYLCFYALILGVLYLVGRSNPIFMLAFLGLALLYMLAVWITTVVFAFKDNVTSGILCIICGIYAVYWVYKQSDNNFLKAAYSLYCILWAVFYFARRLGGLSGE
jgi:hypothetical protein